LAVFRIGYEYTPRERFPLSESFIRLTPTCKVSKFTCSEKRKCAI